VIHCLSHRAGRHKHGSGSGVIAALNKEWGKIVAIGNYAQLINCLGLIRTDDRGIVKTTSYYSFEMIFRNSYRDYLMVDLECPAFTNKKFGMVQEKTTHVLDAGATMSDDGKNISLIVVNRHLEKSIEAGISFSGFNSQRFVCNDIITLTHEDPFARNTPDNRENIIPQHLSQEGRTLDDFSFPPCSITVVKLQAS